MKKYIIIIVMSILAILAGCAGSKPRLVEEKPYYTKQQSDSMLCEQEELLHQSFGVVVMQLDSLRRVTEELDARFNEYRRNTLANDIPEYVDFCDERVPIEIPDVKERLYKEVLFTSENQAQLALFYMRSKLYFPVIESLLVEHDMPNDLKWIALIESGLRATPTSKAKAKGWWQFIPSTGKVYALDQSSYKDMRNNLIASTSAAIKYFDTLYSRFDNWALACAGYNMGENGLSKLMKDQNVTDYYHLWLPKETENYLFRAIGLKLILSNPGAYGIMPEKFAEWERQESDTVSVTVKNSLSAKFVAQMCGTTYRQIRLFNPELTKESWGPGKHIITVPPGTKDALLAALKDVQKGKKKK